MTTTLPRRSFLAAAAAALIPAPAVAGRPEPPAAAAPHRRYLKELSRAQAFPCLDPDSWLIYEMFGTVAFHQVHNGPTGWSEPFMLMGDPGPGPLWRSRVETIEPEAALHVTVNKTAEPVRAAGPFWVDPAIHVAPAGEHPGLPYRLSGRVCWVERWRDGVWEAPLIDEAESKYLAITPSLHAQVCDYRRRQRAEFGHALSAAEICQLLRG